MDPFSRTLPGCQLKKAPGKGSAFERLSLRQNRTAQIRELQSNPKALNDPTEIALLRQSRKLMGERAFPL
jgi:hypothetical protein